MNKCGHLLVTKSLTKSEFAKYKFWILFGSILPDILMYTYAVGHTWEASYENLVKKMKKLENHGEMNWYSCLKLGYILHYIEDYFTFPHNKHYKGNLKEHVQYEADFSKYLKEKSPVVSRDNQAVSVEMLCDCMKVAHQNYMNQNGNFENDRRNIYETSVSVMQCFYLIFQRNQMQCQMDINSRTACSQNISGILGQ